LFSKLISFITSWKNVSHNQFDRIKHEEEFEFNKMMNQTNNLNSAAFSSNPNAISNSESEKDLNTPQQQFDNNNDLNNTNTNINNFVNYSNQMILEKPKIKKDMIGRYLMEKMGWKGQGILLLILFKILKF